MAISRAALPHASLQQILRWVRRPLLARRLALVLALAAVLSSAATYVAFSERLESGGNAELVLGLLYLDVTLLLLLGAVVARQLTQLFIARWEGSAGSRLHARLVALFSVVAVAPAILVGVFSITFVHYGLEAWFSERIKNTLDNSREIAQSYYDEHQDNIRADALLMRADLDREAVNIVGDPQFLQRLLNIQAQLRELTEVAVLRSDGQVVAKTGLTFSFEIERLEPAVIERAAAGEVVVLKGGSDDRVRALVRLDSFIDAYLFVGRFVDSKVLSYVDETERLGAWYTSLERQRSRIEITFAIVFGVVAMLLLLAAVWIGLSFANALAQPISGLIVAADLVRVGDLSARVPAGHDEDDELDRLARAFNRMASQLEDQRDELVMANQQLDRRRRFTETVISGVSAGVIGLDAQGRIVLPNRSASAFFGRDAASLTGQPMIAVLPELGGYLAAVSSNPERAAEGHVEIQGRDKTSTLFVRVAAQRDEATVTGYVVTFDDITELLAAQEKAAWAEIARRIAHEIKNPLTPIRLNAERLKRRYLAQIEQDPEGFAASADTIVRQVDNIGRLINEFSAYARMPAPVFRRESAADLVRQAVNLQQGARPAITFETRLPEHEVALYCDSRQVAQALTNLLQNAVDSILESEQDDGRAGPGWIMVSLDDSRDEVVIEVHDDGKGLPDEPVERLTKPYVTTRASGTGLGLAIVRKIMDEHGGRVFLRRRDGGGARVGLAFPPHHAVAQGLSVRSVVG